MCQGKAQAINALFGTMTCLILSAFLCIGALTGSYADYSYQGQYLQGKCAPPTTWAFMLTSFDIQGGGTLTRTVYSAFSCTPQIALPGFQFNSANQKSQVDLFSTSKIDNNYNNNACWVLINLQTFGLASVRWMCVSFLMLANILTAHFCTYSCSQSCLELGYLHPFARQYSFFSVYCG